MDTYRETNEEPEPFYVDTFEAAQQLEIIAVIRQIGGQVEYKRDAAHLGDPRARYLITLPAGCVHAGEDSHMAPQTITLPGGLNMRKLCLYPRSSSVHLAWLPGESERSEMWNGAALKPEYAQVVELEASEKLPADVVTPFLEIDYKQIPDSVSKFVEALARYLADQTDVTGLKVSNLRLMAQSLWMNFQRIDGLLEIIEKRQDEQRRQKS